MAVVKAADAPVICETGEEGRKDDIAFLREHLGWNEDRLLNSERTCSFTLVN